MPLPRVQVTLNADGTGEVLINGEKLPGVIGVSILGAVRDVPQVAVTLRADQVVADLPESGVQLVQAGGGATDFAQCINPARLEGLALQHLELNDGTQGEAFAAAAALMAAEFDETHRG